MIYFLLIAYIIIGIGYAKVFCELTDDYDDHFMFVIALCLWPIFLTISAFWNFK